MATYTDHYNLKKPAQNERANIADINGNMDLIDAALNNVTGGGANPPYIGENGNWYIWDTDTQTWVDSEFSAEGVDGTDGTDGAAATVAVGTVTTLAAGRDATVTNRGTSDAAVFDFGIPKGADGSGSGTVNSVNAQTPDTNGAVTVDGGDILLTGYTSQSAAEPAATDSVNAGIGKAYATANEKASPSSGKTAALTVAGWSNKTQTVNVTGVTASNNIVVSPAPASFVAYAAAQIRATAQSAGTVTFACETVPAAAITVNVLIVG